MARNTSDAMAARASDTAAGSVAARLGQRMDVDVASPGLTRGAARPSAPPTGLLRRGSGAMIAGESDSAGDRALSVA